MANEGARFVSVTINEDGTEAYAGILDVSVSITKRDVVWKLAEENVRGGIIHKNISKMLEEKDITKTYLVAECNKPVDGTDGWFEFLFDTDVDTKPKILEDGSVDYSAYGNLPSVEENERLVIYHPATASRDGENFWGERILAQKGKELAKLKGKGFYISDDGKEYFAKTAGRVKYEGERLVVDDVLEIKGDASISTGDIQFINDIHVFGNVLTGVRLHSSKGSIIVDGYVEAAELSAQGDVVLKNGMQGNNKGVIHAGGSVSGKFFEQVSINCGGDVNANAIMNSYVSAKQDIIVSGKFGIIIGGEVKAEREISATIIGNMSEVKTTIRAGVEKNPMFDLVQLEKDYTAAENEQQKLSEALDAIEGILAKSASEEMNMKKIQLIRQKINQEQVLIRLEKERENLTEQIARMHAAKITILKVVYPGTFLSVNGKNTRVKEEVNSIEVVSKGGGIQMLSLL